MDKKLQYIYKNGDFHDVNGVTPDELQAAIEQALSENLQILNIDIGSSDVTYYTFTNEEAALVSNKTILIMSWSRYGGSYKGCNILYPAAVESSSLYFFGYVNSGQYQDVRVYEFDSSTNKMVRVHYSALDKNYTRLYLHTITWANGLGTNIPITINIITNAADKITTSTYQGSGNFAIKGTVLLASIANNEVVSDSSNHYYNSVTLHVLGVDAVVHDRKYVRIGLPQLQDPSTSLYLSSNDATISESIEL